jgi:hypothetical protein
MKDSCCGSKGGLSSWFCPSLVSVVAGVIMMTAGAGKFLAGSGMMSILGGSVLGVFGLDASAGGLFTLALVLGYIAATIELVGWFLFAVGCRKTGKYAALALAVVMAAALSTKFGKLEGLSEVSLFEAFSKVLSTIRLDLLLLAVFVQKSLKVFSCCKSSSCCSTQQSCCGSGKCDK